MVCIIHKAIEAAIVRPFRSVVKYNFVKYISPLFALQLEAVLNLPKNSVYIHQLRLDQQSQQLKSPTDDFQLAMTLIII